jgi:hypothetical protein
MNLPSLLVDLRLTMSTYFTGISSRVKTLITRFNAHEANKANPHGTDKTHVGLDQVENYPPATQQQAIDGVNNTTYLTPKRLTNALDAVAQAFEDATNDLNN